MISKLGPEAIQLLNRLNARKQAPSGNKHVVAYDELHFYGLLHEDAVIELLFSGILTSDLDYLEILHVGGHGGSIARKDNLCIVDRTAKIRQRKNELPLSVQHTLDWLEEVHGW